MDDQEGLGGAVEGAGRQRLGFAGDEVAQVILWLGRLPQGEPNHGAVALLLLLLLLKQVLQRVQEVSWQRGMQTSSK